jgi:predicted adenylyl cyclase CyaB
VFKGTDHQIDTYFKVPHGRLKLREGNIENNLIYYEREEKCAAGGLKESRYIVYSFDPESSLKELLIRALDALVVVEKERDIYFIDNVKFHIDTVRDLGTFLEIEATDKEGTISKEKLLAQCAFFLELFKISQNDLIPASYSDLLLRK